MDPTTRFILSSPQDRRLNEDTGLNVQRSTFNVERSESEDPHICVVQAFVLFVCLCSIFRSLHGRTKKSGRPRSQRRTGAVHQTEVLVFASSHSLVKSSALTQLPYAHSTGF